jgi:serine/threonine-protein kinase RsbW
MGEASRVRILLSRAPQAELVAGQAVEDFGQDLGFSRDTLAEVKLAVVEACLNAFEYSEGDVEVELVAHRENDHPWIEAVVTDHGPGFDPAIVQQPRIEEKLRAKRKRGWGLELMRHLMDEVEISSRPGFTQVRMIRRRGGE